MDHAPGRLRGHERRLPELDQAGNRRHQGGGGGGVTARELFFPTCDLGLRPIATADALAAVIDGILPLPMAGQVERSQRDFRNWNRRGREKGGRRAAFTPQEAGEEKRIRLPVWLGMFLRPEQAM